MKIKSLYIEKFGGLTDKKIEFNDGINIITAENEYGKSTIAEFIKLMLYGTGKSPVSIRENERKRFMPWDEKAMGGQLTVEKDGTKYIISRTFGKRKSDDTISVVNAVTGAAVSELCIDSPGEILIGVGRDGFEKSLYIKQLSTKIIADKDDEILKMLVNLAQNGDDGVSYAKALQVLDAAIKEINGTRPKGKLPLLRERISELHAQKIECQNSSRLKENYIARLKQLEEESEALKSHKIDKSIIEKSKNLYSKIKNDMDSKERVFKSSVKRKKLGYIIQIAISIILTVLLCFVFIPAAPVALAWGVICLIRIFRIKTDFIYTSDDLRELYDLLQIESLDMAENTIKKLESIAEKNAAANTDKMLDLAQQIGDLKSRIENMTEKSVDWINDEINILEQKAEEYNKITMDLNLARECICNAFEQLQKGFGDKLNKKTSEILRHISAGKYCEVLVDENYNMMVRLTENNKLHDAQYLSNGAYDQIYLALRLAVVSLLFNDAPVILDDAFAQYDDSRLKNSIGYIKDLGSQFIIFTCHNREENIIKQI